MKQGERIKTETLTLTDRVVTENFRVLNKLKCPKGDFLLNGVVLNTGLRVDIN